MVENGLHWIAVIQDQFCSLANAGAKVPRLHFRRGRHRLQKELVRSFGDEWQVWIASKLERLDGDRIGVNVEVFVQKVPTFVVLFVRVELTKGQADMTQIRVGTFVRKFSRKKHTGFHFDSHTIQNGLWIFLGTRIKGCVARTYHAFTELEPEREWIYSLQFEQGTWLSWLFLIEIWLFLPHEFFLWPFHLTDFFYYYGLFIWRTFYSYELFF